MNGSTRIWTSIYQSICSDHWTTLNLLEIWSYPLITQMGKLRPREEKGFVVSQYLFYSLSNLCVMPGVSAVNDKMFPFPCCPIDRWAVTTYWSFQNWAMGSWKFIIIVSLLFCTFEIFCNKKSERKKDNRKMVDDHVNFKSGFNWENQ